MVEMACGDAVEEREELLVAACTALVRSVMAAVRSSIELAPGIMTGVGNQERVSLMRMLFAAVA
jgi:hypothetical protein